MNKQITMIPVDKLHAHPDNPRKELGDLSELSESIKAKGVLQNLTVVPADDGYTVIIGHRRTEAARLAGLTELPCVVVDMTPIEQIQTMLLENMQRADLTVFEQAQSFQQLIDLGDTVDSLAQKTGFSETTVRRRLKMAELDSKTLKEVSSRQCSLLDYDRLSEIKNIKERNKVLEAIGTNNFEACLSGALRDQKIKENLPAVKKWIKDHKAKEISSSDRFSSKYNRISDVSISKFNEKEVNKSVKKVDTVYYYLHDKWDDFYLYKKAEKTVQKTPQKELDRKKYIAETRKQLDLLSEQAYKLRRQFVDGLKMTQKNERDMLDGAVRAIFKTTYSYTSLTSGGLYNVLGVEPEYTQEARKKLFKIITNDKPDTYPKIVYFSFGDSPSLKPYETYKEDFPNYREEEWLESIYNWLCSLGYEMSDDEIALMNGTHPLYVDKDKEENKN